MADVKTLSGRVAVVTGGSSGIGAATVRQFADLGADVVIGYHANEAGARELLQSLPAGRHEIVRLVLEDATSFATLGEMLKSKFGKLDILVNSAGFTRAIRHGDLEALTDKLFEQILIANVRGPYSAIRALRPLLSESGDALVVSNVAYCAAKAALDNMTMSLARALGPQIRLLTVSPGAVATDFVPGRDRAALEAGAQSTPLRRVIDTEDVASAIVACATHLKASTGSRIVVDGGRHL